MLWCYGALLPHPRWQQSQGRAIDIGVVRKPIGVASPTKFLGRDAFVPCQMRTMLTETAKPRARALTIDVGELSEISDPRGRRCEPRVQRRAPSAAGEAGGGKLARTMASWGCCDESPRLLSLGSLSLLREAHSSSSRQVLTTKSGRGPSSARMEPALTCASPVTCAQIW